MSLPMQTNFPEWLQSELTKRGWSQSDLARFSGVNRQVISSYLNNQRKKPDPEVLVNIAFALKFPPEEVFRRAGLLPSQKKETPGSEELQYLYDNLSPGERAQVIDFARYQSERKTSLQSRELKPARSVLKDKIEQ